MLYVNDELGGNRVLSFNVLVLLLVPVLMLLQMAMPYHVLSPYFYYLSGYFTAIFLPSLIIAVLSNIFKEQIRQCGGLPYGGMLIGYAERSLIFLAFLMLRSENGASLSDLLNSVSFIIAGKAIFRFSTKNSDRRTCADWYILGTFLSVLMGLLISWIFLFEVRPCP